MKHDSISVGFIGLGLMGKPMSRNLLKADRFLPLFVPRGAAPRPSENRHAHRPAGGPARLARLGGPCGACRSGPLTERR